jgi:hypothetical protein
MSKPLTPMMLKSLLYFRLLIPLALAISVGIAWAETGDQPWHVAAAGERFIITRDPDGPWPATVGEVRIWPQVEITTPQVAVVTEAGSRVGASILWSASGEPIDVLFDCSAGAAVYQLYLGEKLGAGPAWEAQAGVVVETRQRAEGGVDTWEQVKQMWEKSAPIQGRSLVPNIFDGNNQHGWVEQFCAHYHGFFAVAAPGVHTFSTISDDASFFFIDGRQVTAWPGWHGTDGGRRGQYHGVITLTAGRHLIDYWVVQGSGGFTAEAAWKPPGKDQFEVMPPQAFLSVARYAITRVDGRDGPDALAFTWEMAGHVAAGVPGSDPTLVAVRLRLFGGKTPGQRAVWRFDDGQRNEGNEVRHVFARGGLLTVNLELTRGPRTALIQRRRIIAVHPLWTQGTHFPERIWESLRRDLLGRDYNLEPPADLAALVRFALAMDDPDLVGALGEVVIHRAKEFAGAEAQCLLDLGFHFQHQDVRQYQRAADCLRACAEAPQPALAMRARVHLTGLLIHDFADLAAAEAQFAAIVPDQLPAEERRLLLIYRGDAALAANDVATARGKYLAAGTVVAPGDLRYAVNRRIRLEQARDFLSQGDLDAAADLVRAIEWETPLERLGTETGLLLVRIWTGRKELAFALSRCRAMLAAAPDDARRPEVLLALVRVRLAAGNRDQAGAAARQLLADHPYSEAAARVKDLIAMTTTDEGKKP